MPRWSKEEQSYIAEVKKRLRTEIASAPNFPEVIGDRKIIRFLRGHDYAIDKVCDLMKKFLMWRIDNKVDEIRRQIVEGGIDHPLRFPKGELIMSLLPQVVLAYDALDNTGCPICVDQYDFSPSELLSKISIEDYIVFVTYVLEYRSCILEQMSEEREQAYLSSLSIEERAEIDSPDSIAPPYGVIVHTCVIRDLGALGFEHIGSQGREIIKSVVRLASDNYPELMRKCYLVNTSWMFHTLWYFVQGLMTAKTIAKVAVLGADFREEIASDIPPQNIPKLIGGPYDKYIEGAPFPFNRRYLCPSAGTKDGGVQTSVVRVAEAVERGSIADGAATSENGVDVSVSDTIEPPHQASDNSAVVPPPPPTLT